jgi:hypothetical protein
LPDYSDTASVTWGKHTLRFGGIFAHGGVDYYRAGDGRGESGDALRRGVPDQGFAQRAGELRADICHRFTLSAIYDLSSRKSWAQMLEGWQLTSILMVETGPPVLLYDNRDDISLTGEGPGNANNERWNIQGILRI